MEQDSLDEGSSSEDDACPVFPEGSNLREKYREKCRELEELRACVNDKSKAGNELARKLATHMSRNRKLALEVSRLKREVDQLKEVPIVDVDAMSQASVESTANEYRKKYIVAVNDMQAARAEATKWRMDAEKARAVLVEELGSEEEVKQLLSACARSDRKCMHEEIADLKRRLRGYQQSAPSVAIVVDNKRIAELETIIANREAECSKSQRVRAALKSRVDQLMTQQRELKCDLRVLMDKNDLNIVVITELRKHVPSQFDT